MLNLIAIGDPIIDTHVQIAPSTTGCRIQNEPSEELCFVYGAKIPIIDSFQDLGGNAPNVAVGAVKLGLASAVVATIGEDSTGKMALEQLKKRGVNTDFITFDPKGKTRYSIVLNYEAERTILSFSDKKTYRWPENVPPTEWVYYTGLSAGFEIIQECLLAYLKKNRTTRLAVNPGSFMLAYAPDKLAEIIKHTDLLIVNLEEAEKITATTLEKEKSISSLIHKLLASGTKEVVLTDGVRGASAGTADELWHLDTFPVKAVAKTGAGDAFSSAYIAARQMGHDIPKALQWGTANSCSVIQYDGPHKGLLSVNELPKIINQFPEISPKNL